MLLRLVNDPKETIDFTVKHLLKVLQIVTVVTSCHYPWLRLPCDFRCCTLSLNHRLFNDKMRMMMVGRGLCLFILWWGKTCLLNYLCYRFIVDYLRVLLQVMSEHLLLIGDRWRLLLLVIKADCGCLRSMFLQGRLYHALCLHLTPSMKTVEFNCLIQGRVWLVDWAVVAQVKSSSIIVIIIVVFRVALVLVYWKLWKGLGLDRAIQELSELFLMRGFLKVLFFL